MPLMNLRLENITWRVLLGIRLLTSGSVILLTAIKYSIFIYTLTATSDFSYSSVRAILGAALPILHTFFLTLHSPLLLQTPLPSEYALF
jgi:hypothetical protein